MKDGSHCFCGYDYDDMTQHNVSRACSGGKGGEDAIDVYRNSESYGYVGCYADSASEMARDLGSPSSISTCQLECLGQQFKYFGLTTSITNDVHCFCDNNLFAAMQSGESVDCQHGTGKAGAPEISIYENLQGLFAYSFVEEMTENVFVNQCHLNTSDASQTQRSER